MSEFMSPDIKSEDANYQIRLDYLIEQYKRIPSDGSKQIFLEDLENFITENEKNNSEADEVRVQKQLRDLILSNKI